MGAYAKGWQRRLRRTGGANGMGLPLLIGSFGASAVLVFGAPSSPLARARNVIGGHVFLP